MAWKLQKYQQHKLGIIKRFIELRDTKPELLENRLTLSWSIWMFGEEPMERSLERLKKFGINHVELKGNYYSDKIRPSLEKIQECLKQFDIKVSGICGMYSNWNDLSSPDPYIRNNAVDYIKLQLEFADLVGGAYLIVVPSAVGRPNPTDIFEFRRSVETMRVCTGFLNQFKAKIAIEPIRSAEVSLIHTVEDALSYINAVNHPLVYHINADTYHMLVEEESLVDSILKCGDRLINLHVADSNRGALGTGLLDLDSVIMASYLVGLNLPGRYVTFEPLGKHANPYVMAHGIPEEKAMDELVHTSVEYFREREEFIRQMRPEDLEKNFYVVL